MAHLSRPLQDLQRVLALSWELAGLHDASALIDCVLGALLDLLSGDVAGYNCLDLSRGLVELRLQPHVQGDERQAELLARELDEHPVIRHYRAQPAMLAPVRLSDIMPDEQWRATRTYEETLRHIAGEHQLAVPLYPFRLNQAQGYAINRSDRDFTEDEVGLAELIQPVVTAVHASLSLTAAAVSSREEVRQRVGLTTREHEVLSLVATGLTADSIGRTLRISPRTVRKHLEHSYEKIGCHDRLRAVDEARRLGVIAMPEQVRPNG